MAHEDDLLACLLDVAEAELKSLNRNENANSSKEKEIVPQNKKEVKILHDIDIFSVVNNTEESNILTEKSEVKKNRSTVHAGDTDSSDDEACRNLEQKKYNESGKAVKKLIAHAESFCTKNMKGPLGKSRNTLSCNWNSKPIGQLLTPSGKETSVVSYDTLFGIRVINPTIASNILQDKMVGRRIVPIQHISSYLKSMNKSDDWVVAGVICSKGSTKTSSTGGSFIIWTLSDLKGDIKTVGLFLFGAAYNQFWKTQSGSVIGVLNPSVLENRDGARVEANLSVDNPQKLLILGQSKDFGTCKSTKKNGYKCTAIVNKNECEYCVYHIKKEYQRSSRRSELQSNFSGKGLIALRNKVLGKSEVFYAGKSYTSIPAKQSKKLIKKDKDRLQSLSGVTANKNVKKPMVKKAAASFDVIRGQRLKDLETLQKLKGNFDKLDIDTVCKNLGNSHSNEVTLSEAKEKAIKVLSKVKKKSEGDDLIQNEIERNPKKITLRDSRNGILGNEKTDRKNIERSSLSHNYELLQKSLNEIVQTDFIHLKSNNEPTVNELRNKTNIYFETDKCKTSTDITQKCFCSTSKTNGNSIVELLQYKNNISKSVIEKSRNSSVHNEPGSDHIFSKTLLGSMSPSLSNNGGFVDLNKCLPKKLLKAKVVALKYIEKNGPLEKSDPNSVKAKGVKRSISDTEFDMHSQKVQKIQGNNNFSDRFKKMMEIQSKHIDLVQLRDDQEKEKYFKKQEVREKMEEKMANTYKVECKAVKCMDCKYTNYSAGEKCKLEKHRLVYKDVTKRFFKCGNCGYRVASLEIIPLIACKNCGGGRWERTTMMKEKNITNTVALSIRGGEQKFINSDISDANINLLVPDES